VLPEPVTEGGLKPAVHPVGRSVTWKPTVGFDPPAGDTLIVYVAVPPPRSVTFPGEAESEKSPPAAVPTTSVTMVEWVTLGLVPVIMTEYVPAGVELVVMVRVDEPDPPLIEAGLKPAVAPAGSPLALRPTGSVNPPEAATLTV